MTCMLVYNFDQVTNIALLGTPHQLNCCRLIKISPQWGTADAEIKDPSVECPELKGFSLSNEDPHTGMVGQNKATYASPTARDFFLELISTHPVHSVHFFPNLSRVFPVLAVANTDSSAGPQNKIGHPARRSR